MTHRQNPSQNLGKRSYLRKEKFCIIPGMDVDSETEPVGWAYMFLST